MLTLAAPWALAAGAVASAVVLGLHLLAWRRPAPTLLPTARFAPPSAVRAVSRDLRLSDRLLLRVRVAVLLLAGLALARPAWTPVRSGTARVFVLDASRRVARVGDVADSARMLSAGAATTAWVRVDSVARLLSDTTLGPRAAVRGALSAGLVAAVREAVRLARVHDTVEVVVVSPFATESWDASMDAVRAQWGGAVRAIRVAAAVDSSAATRVDGSRPPRELPPAGDPLGAAFALALDSTASSLRVTRLPLTAADSAWARDGGVVVSWPRTARSDSVAAPQVLVAVDRAVIGRFAREPIPLASGRTIARTIARWGDGTPAADELALSAGCLRSVGVGLPSVGDEVLRPSFLALVRQFATPCGGGSAGVMDTARVAGWARGTGTGAAAGVTSQGESATARPGAAPVDGGQSGAATATAAAITTATADPSSHDAERWLLVGVALLLAVEWWLRRRVAQLGVERAEPTQATREAA